MRWVRWALVAGWVGVHAALWALLPPRPRFVLPDVAPHGFGMTPDGRSLVASDAATVSAWDLTTGRRTHAWPRPLGLPYDQSDPVVAPTGRWAVVYDADRQAPVLIDLDTGAAVTLPAVGPLNARPNWALGSAAGFSADGRTYVQFARDPRRQAPAVYVRDLATGRDRFVPVDARVEQMWCDPGGRVVSLAVKDAAGGGFVVQVLDLDTGELRSTFATEFDPYIMFAGLSPDGRTLAVTGTEVRYRLSELQFWDVGTGRKTAALTGTVGIVWNADGLLVAENNGLYLLTPAGDEAAHWPTTSPGPIGPIFAQAGGRYLAQFAPEPAPPWRRWWDRHWPGMLPGWGDQYMVRIRDASSGEERGVLRVGRDYRGIRLSSDGATLAVSDATGTVHVWGFPPRRPAGGVLALMIAEVAAAVAWTVWRRRRRPRCVVP